MVDLKQYLVDADTTVFVPFKEALDLPDEICVPVNDELVAIPYGPLKDYLDGQKKAKKNEVPA